MKGKSLSHVRLLATPWTAAYQAPLSMGFSRQEYWSGVPLSKQQGGNTAPPISRKLDERFTEHGPAFHFSSITQLCPTPFNLMDCRMPGLPVHHQLLELTQTHVHRTGDAIQPSHPPSSPSPPALNLSQHQSLFKLDSSSHQVAKVLEFQLQHQSFQ